MSMLRTVILEVGCLPVKWRRWVRFIRVVVIMILIVRVIEMVVVDRVSRIPKPPINSIWQPGAVNEDRLALVHHRGDVGLTMAVELNDSSVRLLLCLLSSQTVFGITDVE